jgi:transporter family protein
LLSLAAAVLYGLHNLFTRDASGRIDDGWGALVLEATAAVGILVFALARRAPVGATSRGVASAMAAGLCAGAGTILFFAIFRLGGPLSVAGPIVISGGVALMAIGGIALFGETITITRAVGLAFAVAGIALLRR